MNTQSKELYINMGDDIPDLSIMKTVGLPCAPRDADDEVKAAARYITQANGGYGAGRELIEQVREKVHADHGVWLECEIKQVHSN